MELREDAGHVLFDGSLGDHQRVDGGRFDRPSAIGGSFSRVLSAAMEAARRDAPRAG